MSETPEMIHVGTCAKCGGYHGSWEQCSPVQIALTRITEYFDQQCTTHAGCPVPHNALDTLRSALTERATLVEAARKLLDVLDVLDYDADQMLSDEEHLDVENAEMDRDSAIAALRDALPPEESTHAE